MRKWFNRNSQTRNKAASKFYLNDMEKHLGSLDWSKPVIIKPHQMTVTKVQLHGIMHEEDDDESIFNIFLIPTYFTRYDPRDFKCLFTSAYQKCLYGPLTSIPRPLK